MTPIEGHVQAAKEAAVGKKLDPPRRLRIFLNGPLIERARSNLDAAEALLLSLALAEYVLGQMPSLHHVTQTRQHRPASGGQYGDPPSKYGPTRHMYDSTHYGIGSTTGALI